MSNMKALLLSGAVAFIVITTKVAQQDGTEPANRLRLSLAHDQAGSGPDKAMHFTVTFGNLKRKDVTLNRGVLDCGSPPNTSAITLNLTDSRGNRRATLLSSSIQSL